MAKNRITYKFLCAAKTYFNRNLRPWQEYPPLKKSATVYSSGIWDG